MLERVLQPLNGLALEHVDRRWVDYMVSNTMTDFNRWWNGFVWTYDLKAQVIQVITEAPGVKTFVLRPNQHWLGMKAGQFVEVTMEINGQEVRRHYSPSVLPKGRISITVKAVGGGMASRWMHNTLRRGTVIKLGRPQGRFCREASQSRLLFLCAGSGITPCHAIVDELLGQAPAERPDVQVLAQFRQAEDVIFKEALQARWPQEGVKVHVALSGSGSPDARLDARALQRLCTDLKERDIYLCGPAGFMTSMIAHLRALDVDMRRVHTERFVTADAFAAPGADFDVVGAEVYFQHLDTTIKLTAQDKGKTLLEVAKTHGVDVESGCGQGMCGTCRLNLHDGQVSGNALGKVVYLCSSYPASTRVVLDA